MLANRSPRALLLATLALTTHPIAQSDWARQTSVFPLTRGPLCQDVQPNNILMVADRETASWDGTRWTIAAAAPPQLSGPALACDTTRGRVVLFGGYDSNQSGMSNATWEWDGVVWRQQSPATSPPARIEHAMAFDPTRGRVVLCGGRDSAYRYVNDTWEWDGANWTQVAAAVSPPARSWHAMAWHGNLGRVLLFGGRTQTANRVGDTWVFDGTSWTQLAIGFGPAPRYLPYLAPDTAGNVLLQGGSIPAPANDTWRFDGTNWSALAPVTAPIGLVATTMAHAAGRSRTVLLAADANTVTQVYEWDGVNWRMASRHEFLPGAAGPMAGFTSHYGGSPGVMLHVDGEIWTSTSGTSWQRVNVPSTGVRTGAALAHDTRRGRTVLFGGLDANGYGNETWEFYGGGNNGDHYLQRMTPAWRPPPQGGGLMAYDAARQQCILLGSDALTGTRGTWAWDGTNWTQLASAAGTPATAMAGMAYDPYLQRILLFGRAATADLPETWEWDGTSWLQRQPAVSPPPRVAGAMTFDEVRGRVTLFGGAAASGPVFFNDTWEWDGSSWAPVVTLNTPTPRYGHGMAHFARRTILFGGRDQSSWFRPETWSFAHSQPASWTSFELGCYGYQRYAVLGPMTHRPWLGESVLLQAMLVPVNGPVALLLGDSRTSYAGLPLPLNLTGIGMTWCQLLVAPQMFVGMATANSLAMASLQIPLDPGLIGGALYAQAMAFDPLANAFGAYMSNGLEGRFGLR